MDYRAINCTATLLLTISKVLATISLHMQQHFTSSEQVHDMKEIISTVSSKGQVTVPAEVRKHLGIKQGDKLSFVIEDEGNVRVQAPRYRDLAALRGAAGKLEKPLHWQEMMEIAHEDHARELTHTNTITNTNTK